MRRYFGGTLSKYHKSFILRHLVFVRFQPGHRGSPSAGVRAASPEGKVQGETGGSLRSPVIPRTENHGGQKEGKGRLPCGRELHRPLALEGRDRSSSLEFTEPRENRSLVLSTNQCMSGVQNQARTTSYNGVSL